MSLIIFDDSNITDFYPITLTRSAGELRSGIMKLKQRIAAYMCEENTGLIIPDSISEVYQERKPLLLINKLNKDSRLMINSRLKINKNIAVVLQKLQSKSVLLNEDEDFIAANIEGCSLLHNRKISTEDLKKLLEQMMGELNFKVFRDEKMSLWRGLPELIAQSGTNIVSDYNDFFYDKDNYYEVETGVTVQNPYNIWLGENVELKPGVVLDGSEGPIIIDGDTKILSNSVVTGPVFIGRNCLIKAGSRVYQNTSIGKYSKVGGEIEASIIQGYSNKQHDGFLGHSYLGEWVNLGAGTNNSDLKNNYGEIKIYSIQKQKMVGTGQRFMGAIIGDHTKTGIGVSINTGCVLGVGVNVFGSNLVKDFVPSFSWGEFGDLSEYEIEKCLQTMDMVKKRRNLFLSQLEKVLYRKLRLKDLETKKRELIQ